MRGLYREIRDTRRIRGRGRDAASDVPKYTVPIVTVCTGTAYAYERISVSQSVSDFTVPPRAHPSTGSQSGSATPGVSNTSVPSTRSRGLLNRSQVRSISPSGQGVPCRFLPRTSRAGLC